MRLSRLILLFAIAFAVLLIAPALLSQPFGPYPLMKTGDVVDLLTPLVLLPLYWLLFRLDEPPSTRETLLFLVLAAAWVEGQGMHLSANSIGHLLQDATETDVYRLTHFYDEVLSHYLWHIGIVGLTALLLWRQTRRRFAPASIRLEQIAGLIYGIVYFIIFIEAGTVPLGLPFALIVTALGLLRWRGQFRQQPLTTFFTAAHLIASILFLIWFIRWGGFPQFSELGII
ncbi:MAG: hypothetical protein HZC41_06145 [Chloroflexi bacterium]|nr:hypothetical protein [Chloroflexota bacterium]